jgi:hypothetical protein
MTEMNFQAITDQAITDAEIAAANAEIAASQPERIVRAFFKSDYARFAGLLQRSRKLQHTASDPKPDEVQAYINQAAVVLANVFAADSMTAGDLPYAFDRDRFLAATELPQPAGEDVTE